mgnify:CR=1 FL=1
MCLYYCSLWKVKCQTEFLLKCDTKFLISLFERAFKMIKSGVYFIVITPLVAELFKILVYANQMTCDVIVDTKWCKITKNGISLKTFFV